MERLNSNGPEQSSGQLRAGKRPLPSYKSNLQAVLSMETLEERVMQTNAPNDVGLIEVQNETVTLDFSQFPDGTYEDQHIFTFPEIGRVEIHNGWNRPYVITEGILQANPEGNDHVIVTFQDGPQKVESIKLKLTNDGHGLLQFISPNAPVTTAPTAPTELQQIDRELNGLGIVHRGGSVGLRSIQIAGKPIINLEKESSLEEAVSPPRFKNDDLINRLEWLDGAVRDIDDRIEAIALVQSDLQVEIQLAEKDTAATTTARESIERISTHYKRIDGHMERRMQNVAPSIQSNITRFREHIARLITQQDKKLETARFNEQAVIEKRDALKNQLLTSEGMLTFLNENEDAMELEGQNLLTLLATEQARSLEGSSEEEIVEEATVYKEPELPQVDFNESENPLGDIWNKRLGNVLPAGTHIIRGFGQIYESVDSWRYNMIELMGSTPMRITGISYVSNTGIEKVPASHVQFLHDRCVMIAPGLKAVLIDIAAQDERGQTQFAIKKRAGSARDLAPEQGSKLDYRIEFFKMGAHVPKPGEDVLDKPPDYSPGGQIQTQFVVTNEGMSAETVTVQGYTNYNGTASGELFGTQKITVPMLGAADAVFTATIPSSNASVNPYVVFKIIRADGTEQIHSKRIMMHRSNASADTGLTNAEKDRLSRLSGRIDVVMNTSNDPRVQAIIASRNDTTVARNDGGVNQNGNPNDVTTHENVMDTNLDWMKEYTFGVTTDAYLKENNVSYDHALAIGLKPMKRELVAVNDVGSYDSGKSTTFTWVGGGYQTPSQNLEGLSDVTAGGECWNELFGAEGLSGISEHASRRYSKERGSGGIACTDEQRSDLYTLSLGTNNSFIH